jgi:hypothetical protein
MLEAKRMVQDEDGDLEGLNERPDEQTPDRLVNDHLGMPPAGTVRSQVLRSKRPSFLSLD